MKKTAALLLAACMLLACLPVLGSAAGGLFSEDFDGYADFAAAEAAGWARGASNTDEEAAVRDNPSSGGGRMMMLTTAGAGESRIAHSGIGADLIKNDGAVLELNLCAIGGAADRKLMVTDQGGAALVLASVSGGSIFGPDGKTVLAQWTGETWTKLAAVVNSVDSEVTLYLDGRQAGGPQKLADGAPAGIESVIVSQTGQERHSTALLIDDMRVYIGTKPDGTGKAYGKSPVVTITLPPPVGYSDLPVQRDSGRSGLEVYVKDDFTGYYTHPDWHGRDIPPDWYTGWNNNGRFQSHKFNDKHGDTVHFSTTGAGQTPYINRENLGGIVGKGDYVAQFDIYLPDDNGTRSFSMADGAGRLRSIFRFKNDGSILMDTTGGGVLFGQNTHQWMTVAVVFHAETGLVDGYLNGELKLANQQLIETVQPGLDRIKFDLTGDAKGAAHAYLDNVAIYSGTELYDFAELPAPASDKYLDTIFDTDPKFDQNVAESAALKLGSASAIVNNSKTKVDPGNPKVVPYEENGVTLVPIRFISEAFGAEVSFDEASSTAVIRFGGGTTELRIREGEDITYVNGGETVITRAMSREERIFVPLRYIAEQLGKKVWFHDGVIVIGERSEPFNMETEQKSFNALKNHLTFEYPTKEQIKKDYDTYNGLADGQKIAHPRMFADSAKLDEIRGKLQTDENMAKWYKGVKARAEAALASETPGWYFDADGTMLGRVRSVMDKIENWVMVYQMETDPAEKKKYLDRTWKEIKGVVDDWPDWDFMHFLDPSEMARAVAFAYDWMYDGWTEEQRSYIHKAIKERALQPAYDSYKGYGNVTWVKLENNWSLVCHGSMIIAALATFDEDPDFNAQIMEWAMRSWENVMYQFAPEGAWEEGVTYWNFAIRYYIPTMDVMNWFLGTDYGYFDNVEGMKRTGYFPPYMTGPLGQFNFHDASESFEKTEAHFWMAKRLNDPDLAGYRLNQILQGNSDTSIYDLLWYDPECCNIDVELPRDALFNERVTTATFRSSWTDSGALFGGLHGAYNNVNHGHIDAGTFILDALGVRWANDLGSDSYALPGYMNNPNIYRRRAEGHNTIVVDPPGRQQGSYFYDQEPDATGVIDSYVSKDKGGYVIMDLTQTNKKMESAKRGMFMLPGREQLMVQDEIKLKSPGDVWWFMHTKTDVAIAADGRSATLTSGGKTLNATIVSEDATLTFGVMDAVPLPGSPVVDGQQTNKGIRKLYINGKDKTEFNAAVVFTPLPDATITPEIPQWQPMAEWAVPDGRLAGAGDSYVNEITIGGQKLEEYYPQQNTYTYKLKPGTQEAPEVSASFAGDADMKILQAEDTNGTAVISLRDGETGRTKYYMIQFAVGTMLGEPEGVKEYQIAGAVASDVPQPENGTEHSYDGDLSSRWSAEGVQYVDFDLGEEKEVGAVSVAWYRGDERSTEYSVELSVDGKRWSEVFRGISLDNTLDYNTTIFAPQNARYIRVRGYGNTINAWNSIADTKIFPAVDTGQEG